MSQTYGIEVSRPHTEVSHREPVRYVVIIEAGGSMVAMLFFGNHVLASEIDAGAEEAASLIAGLRPVVGALGAEWDRALGGHSSSERAAARVYTLPV